MEPSRRELNAEQSERVDHLASDFLERVARDEDPPLEEYLERLESPPERAEFQELLRFALTPESCAAGKLSAGAMLGPYRIEEQIGAGGMGVVYRAWDTRLDRKVAIKVLSPKLFHGEAYRARFTLESKILARFRHPGIVTIHEAGSRGELRYLVMDYLEGIPLDELIERLGTRASDELDGAAILAAIGQPVPPQGTALFAANATYWEAIARIALAIVRAIQAAHCQGILHHDLKPSNIMLLGGAHPVVLDFGLAALAERQPGHVPRGLCGTVLYLAPEQARRGSTGRDCRTDIYQLGLILYELITRKPALGGRSLGAVWRRVRRAAIARPRALRPEMPRDLEAICLKALRADPAARYRSAGELGDDLAAFLERRPTRARPPALARRAGMMLQRNPRIALAAAIALVLGALTGTVLWQREAAPLFEPRLAWGDPLTFARQAPPELEDGTWLGAVARLEKPTTIAAFSVMGVGPNPADQLILSPAPPRLLDDPPEVEPPLLRTLPAGESSVLISRFRTAQAEAMLKRLGKEGAPWYEGIWILHSSDLPTWLPSRLEQIRREALELQREQGAAFPFLPIARAFEILRLEGGSQRGGPLTSIDPRVRAQLARAWKRFESNEKDYWMLENPELFAASFPTRLGKH